LLALLTNITVPGQQDELQQISSLDSSTGRKRTREYSSYARKFIEEDVLPNVGDSFWRGRLAMLLSGESRANSVHLAIFMEPYLKLVLEGRKTVEARLNSHRCAPYQKVEVGDILLLKRSGGSVVGLCEVANVWFYQLDPESWETIKRDFAQDLAIQDGTFWQTRERASYATLMRIRNVCPIRPTRFVKHDRRGWVLLKANGEAW